MPGCRPSTAAACNMQRSCERSSPSLFTSPRGYTQSRDSDSKRACVLVSPLRACPPYHGRLGLATQVGNGTAVATWPQPTFGTVASTVNDRFGSIRPCPPSLRGKRVPRARSSYFRSDYSGAARAGKQDITTLRLNSNHRHKEFQYVRKPDGRQTNQRPKETCERPKLCVNSLQFNCGMTCLARSHALHLNALQLR